MDKIVVFLLFAMAWTFLIICVAYAQTSVIRLDQITAQDMSMIQKQHDPNISQCAVDNIAVIVRDQLDGANWVVVIDSSIADLALNRLDNSASIVCTPTGTRMISTQPDGLKLDQLTPYGSEPLPFSQ